MSFLRSAALLTTAAWWGCAAPVLADDAANTPDKPRAAAVAASAAPPAQPATAASASPLTDLTVAPPELWQRIRNDFGLPDLTGPLVRQQEQWLLRHPDYLRNAIARSSRYLYHVVDAVEQRGMPSEIALLPFVESAYNPTAYSRAHASGIWQFIPSTAKLYGLEQNFWYDGRRDVVAATDAALDYLEKLYEMFGSWNLALAAYNWGENGVTRAIAKNETKGLPTDYLSLKLPRETRDYVPKLQAIKNIIADPQRYGINLADIPNRPYFAAVTTDRHIDVRLAAKFAQVPVEEFVSLNPAYTRPVIRVDGEETLLLPADKVDIFRANFEQHQDAPLVSWSTYTLKRGDRLNRVAAKHGISLAQLKRINGISSRHRIGPGMTVLVPVTAADADVELPDLPAPPPPVFKTRRVRHHASHHHNGTKTGSKMSTAAKPVAAAGRLKKSVVLAQDRPAGIPR